MFFLATPIQAEYSGDAKAHFEKGLNYLGQGFSDLALEEIREAVRLEPKVVDGHRYLATAHSLKLHLKKALDEYNTIFEINQDLTNVPPSRVLSVEENKQLVSEFIEGLKELEDREHHNPMIHAVLGWLYGEEGNLKAADKEILVALEKKPSLGDEYLDPEESDVGSLMTNLAEAMQNNPHLAKTQADLFLFSLNK